MTVWPEGRMEFVCTALAEDGGREQRWLGEVMVKRYGMEMAELLIYVRDSCINAVSGKYMSGQYICISDIDTECPLSRLSDLFWNRKRKRLLAHINYSQKAALMNSSKCLCKTQSRIIFRIIKYFPIFGYH